MKLMRVIMLTWEYPPKIVGGIARHAYDLAHAYTTVKNIHTPSPPNNENLP
jgi:hypothetical protein